LYVGNLAYAVANSDLEQLFSQVGRVQSAAVIMDKISGQSKGFGFSSRWPTAEEASKVIRQFNDTELKGRNIKVNEAKPRESGFGTNTRRAAIIAAATAGRKLWGPIGAHAFRSSVENLGWWRRIDDEENFEHVDRYTAAHWLSHIGRRRPGYIA
jgi:RNA recognition motif-containing protein